MDSHIRTIEAALQVKVAHRFEQFRIEGPKAKANQALETLQALYEIAKKPIPAETVQLMLSGDTALPGGDDALAMQTRRGEMIHAIQQGIPFDPVAWAGTPNLPQFEASARRRLLEVAGVREVVAFSARMGGDVLTYSATLRTDFGEVALNG